MRLLGLCNISHTPRGISDVILLVFFAHLTFFVPPEDFLSHSTGLFRLCNVFCTPRKLHLKDLFGLCNVLYPSKIALFGSFWPL